MKPRPPGLLRVGVDPDVLMMICTAGHVDHGKTSLVKLLTGCNTDRLKEEQERGLTIELGFAPCMLRGNLCVGIVDVPGHEKFVRNMVAGVSGIDMTVLVIAADDGIMPQTIEHLQIMELLGVRHGMVALTKTDLVAPERIPTLRDEIGAFLEGTFLEGAPICPVSSETGEGYFDFYNTLVERATQLARRRGIGLFRMPIERVFTQKGFGVVVTGIPVDGSIRVGGQVEVVPGGQVARVRGIQRFLRDSTEGSCGQCLALNLPELSKAPPERGQVVCVPGYLKAADCFHVRLKAVAGLPAPLRNAEQIKFHAGTAEQPGKVYLVEGATLGAGQSAFATVVLSDPVAAAVHDRFIIRRASPAATVAGGEILAVDSAAHRPRKRQVLEQLQSYGDFIGNVDVTSPEAADRRVEYFLVTRRAPGVAVQSIAESLLLPPALVGEYVGRLVDTGRVMALPGDLFIHARTYEACLATAESRINEAVAAGNSLSLTLGSLRKGLDWPGPLWERIQADLQQKGMAQAHGSKLVLRAAVDKLSDSDRDLIAAMLDVYEKTGFESPRPDELPEQLGARPADVNRLLEHLYNEGALVRVAKNVVLSYSILKRAQDMVISLIKKDGSLDSADFKHHIGSSRKYALAILDFLDARKVTLRADNIRRLAPGYERRLL